MWQHEVVMSGKTPALSETDPSESDYAAVYDAWFHAEVEAGIREADDPNTVWVTNEEVHRESESRRDRWRAT